MIGVLVGVLVLLAQTWPDQGKVVSTVEKGADFDSVRTYAWERGVEPSDKSVGKLITAAVDAELAARGLKQVGVDADTALVREVALRYRSLVNLACEHLDLHGASNSMGQALHPSIGGAVLTTCGRNPIPGDA